MAFWDTLVNVFEFAANSPYTSFYVVIGVTVGAVAGIVTNRTNNR